MAFLWRITQKSGYSVTFLLYTETCWCSELQSPERETNESLNNQPKRRNSDILSIKCLQSNQGQHEETDGCRINQAGKGEGSFVKCSSAVPSFLIPFNFFAQDGCLPSNAAENASDKRGNVDNGMYWFYANQKAPGDQKRLCRHRAWQTLQDRMRKGLEERDRMVFFKGNCTCACWHMCDSEPDFVCLATSVCSTKGSDSLHTNTCASWHLVKDKCVSIFEKRHKTLTKNVLSDEKTGLWTFG